jgi:Fe-S cluster biogenesis protein NfuA
MRTIRLVASSLPPSYPLKSKWYIRDLKENKMKEQVQKALDIIRPSLQADGGDVELVDVSADGVVKVKLTGACHGCPMSQMTLKMGIEKMIKKQVPEIKEIISV